MKKRQVKMAAAAPDTSKVAEAEPSPADRFVTALVSTTGQMTGGFMTHPTWVKHMRSLWGSIERNPRVLAEVETKLKALHDARLWRGALSPKGGNR